MVQIAENQTFMMYWWLQVSLALTVGLVIGLLLRRRSRSESGPESEPKDQSRELILSALARAARMLFGAKGNDAVMPSALAALGGAVGVDRVYVFENHRDEATGERLASMRYEWCRDGIQPEINNPDMVGMSYDRLLPNWHPIFEAREPIVGLVENMAPAERELLREQDILSILVVPIFLDGEFWGLIGFDDCSSRRQWRQAEIDALEVASGTIGGAIRSMRAEEELRRLVSTDSLTGLSSRRTFMEQARDMFDQVRRKRGELSLLIMDLDHFKQVNDTHGHAAGDEALVGFAKICRRVLRDSDLIGRTGGEEFAVMLPDVGPDQAARIAEKLRSSIADSIVPTDAGAVRLTLSIGVAGLRQGEQDLSELFKRADDALYSAKHGGRDQVAVDASSASA